jgi:hypothetical protein
MTAVLKNFVGREWVDGVGGCRSINPSHTNEYTNLAALEDQFGRRAERRSSDHSEKPVPSN